jgi:hypothetical protein
MTTRVRQTHSRSRNEGATRRQREPELDVLYATRRPSARLSVGTESLCADCCWLITDCSLQSGMADVQMIARRRDRGPVSGSLAWSAIIPCPERDVIASARLWPAPEDDPVSQSKTLRVPPATAVVSRTVKVNRTAVDRGVDWAAGNSQHCQCSLCDHGRCQCSLSARWPGTYLW